MRDDSERQAKVLQMSGRARVALEVMDAKLVAQHEAALAQLLAEFRMGASQEKFLPHIAKLVAIDDLRHMLTGDVRAAQSINPHPQVLK